MAYEALPKAVLYAATLLAVGVAAARWVLFPLDAQAWTTATRLPVERTFRRLAIGTATLAAIALAARAVGHTVVVFGPEALTWENLEIITLESRWGDGWRAQTGAAVLLLAAGVAVIRTSPVPWVLFAVAAAGLTISIPLLGHAAGSVLGRTLHTLHLLGSGVWLGGLAVLVVLLGGRPDVSAQVALVRRFSSMALTGAALVAVTGIAVAVLYVGSPENLSTPYARTLTAKLFLFGGVVWCGRENWRRVRLGSVPRVRLMLAELAFASSVVAMTSVLTELEHP